MGTPYFGKIGNPSKQVKREAFLLNKFIQQHLHKDWFVNGIVVFSNDEARLNIRDPTVAILRPHEISNFIYNHFSDAIEDSQIRELLALLKPYSSFS